MAIAGVDDDQDASTRIAAGQFQHGPGQTISMIFQLLACCRPGQPGAQAVQQVGYVVAQALIDRIGSRGGTLQGCQPTPENCNGLSAPARSGWLFRRVFTGDRCYYDIRLVGQRQERFTVFGGQPAEIALPPQLRGHIQAEQIGSQACHQPYECIQIERDWLFVKFGKGSKHRYWCGCHNHLIPFTLQLSVYADLETIQRQNYASRVRRNHLNVGAP